MTVIQYYQEDKRNYHRDEVNVDTNENDNNYRVNNNKTKNVDLLSIR